jgi:hypothetical protein
VLVGEFPRTPGGRPKSKGFENPFQNNPTPCKIKPQTTRKIMGHNPRMDLCPKSMKKNEKKKRRISEKWVFGEKMGKNPNVRPAVGEMAGERPAVGRGVVGK